MLPAPATTSQGSWGRSAAVGRGDVASSGMVASSPTKAMPAAVDGAPMRRLARAEERTAMVQMMAVSDPAMTAITMRRPWTGRARSTASGLPRTCRS